MKDYLFVYGTLKKELAPPEIFGAVKKLKYIGDGYVHGKLYDLGEYPGAVVDRGLRQKVFGRIYELPEKTDLILHALDGYEEFDPKRKAKSLFVRRKVNVRRPGRDPLRSWMYVYNKTTAAAP